MHRTKKEGDNGWSTSNTDAARSALACVVRDETVEILVTEADRLKHCSKPCQGLLIVMSWTHFITTT